MAYSVIASNMFTGEKKALIIDSPLIDEPNMPGLERKLKENVNLASKDVSIYIIISEKMLAKKAVKSAKVIKANAVNSQQ